MSATGLVLTLEGLREFVRDLRAAGKLPAAILVSEHEKKDLKFELMAGAKETTADAEATVDQCIGFIEGIPIASHKDVPRGRAWLLPHPKAEDHQLIAVR